VFLPIHTAWWAVFGVSLNWLLLHIYNAINSVPILEVIGAYGLAIVVLTVLVKLVLSPLYQLQLILSKRNLDNQRRVAPQLAEVRKKYKDDRQKQQAATMELYREQGVNPLGGLSGCLPSLVQMPILIALYYVFSGNARLNIPSSAHFLFVPNLNSSPFSNPMFHGLPIPALAYLIIPLLAAATTFIQSRMMQQPPNPAASEQEQQAQSMTKQMQVFMPLMILYFAFVTPAGLGLYWFISNCFAIIQQYLVNGWGGLRPQAAPAAVGPAKPPPANRPRPSGPPPRPVRQTSQPRGVTEPKRPRPRKPKR
jgi:YidC/Oxa1 family membrane protein insertase